MRTIVDALRELASPEVLVNGQEKGPLELQESDAMSTCPVTKIEQSGGQVVALRLVPRSFRGGPELPINEWLFPLFDTTRSKPPICRSCDYILFYAPKDHPRELFVFPCELKSGGMRGAWDQLRNGFLLARYLIEVIMTYGKVDPPTEVKFRGIVFANKPTIKVPWARDWLSDERTELKATLDRAGGRKYLKTFCE